MRRILLILVAAVATVAIAWWIAGLPGHVVVTVASYTIETASSLAILGLIIIVGVIVLAIRALAALVRTPRRIGRWRRTRRREAGDASVTRTLVAIAAGDKGDALRSSSRTRRLLGETPQTLLLAAEAERLAGNEQEAAEIYRALASREDAAFLGLRGLFRQAMAREDWAEASSVARRAELAHPGAAWLREERGLLAVRTGNWSQALQLAGPGAPTAAFAIGAADQQEDAAEATRIAKQAFRDNPGFVPAALAYARRLRAEGRESRAQDVLKQAWTQTPHPELADLALVASADKLARVRDATRLVAGKPDDAESRFLLARLNLEAGQIAEARRNAEAARRAGMDQRRLWMLLADLEAQDRGTTEAGRVAQSEALRQAATAQPDPVWRCAACGTIHSAWSPACSACHTPGPDRLGGAAPRDQRPGRTSANSGGDGRRGSALGSEPLQIEMLRSISGQDDPIVLHADRASPCRRPSVG